SQVRLAFRGGSMTKLVPIKENEFAAGVDSVSFVMDGDAIASFTLTEGEKSMTFKPAAEEPKPVAPPKKAEADEEEPAAEPENAPPYEPTVADLAVSSANWPNFRGIESRGVADGQHPPTTWDGPENKNVLWRTPIPGLGNSCPVIWGDKLFVTSAVNESADNDVRIGQYGDVASVEDNSEHDFVVFCLNKKTGEVLWRQTACSAKPAVKRHSKSSHANPTVATDGKHVIAFFGSEGLYCYDMDGNQKWKLDLGLLDSGWFFNAAYQWGFGSSPIIFEDNVIVQCDIQKDSFIAAFRLSDGTEVWRTKRDEIPTWPTPNVHRFGDMPMLITHGTRAARGYDARDGALLWSLKGHSEIVVPTPFVAHDLIFVASGYSPVQPIVAIKPTMRGEIDLPGVQKDDGTTTPEANEQLAWSLNRGGPYMPTPIAYGDFLYCCSNTGILACYRATTGEEVYKERVKVGGAASFTASPIAADGHLYLTAEDGRVAVVRAGEKYKLVSVNPCGTNVLSTPAISAGTFFARTLTEIVAFGEKE
ncbi:MAG: PQQ-binding-like beta-propeller repeat protein, partial [Pirellulaceae bacterium]